MYTDYKQEDKFIEEFCYYSGDGLPYGGTAGDIDVHAYYELHKEFIKYAETCS